MIVRYEASPGMYVTDKGERVTKKMDNAMRHTEYSPRTPEDTIPAPFDTMRLLVYDLRQKIIDKKSLYYIIYTNNNSNLCAAALESKEALDYALVRSLDSGERVMRVGPADEIAGERIFSWDGIPDDFVWALNGGNEANVDFIKHTVFSYQTRAGENGKLNARTLKSNTFHRGLTKAEIERMSNKRVELWDGTAGYFANQILEHRWFGYINVRDWGFYGSSVKLPGGLPSGNYTLHDILLGNYKL